MKTQSPDTGLEAERVMIDLARRMPVERKLQLAGQLSEAMRDLVKAGIHTRHPEASAEELDRQFVELWLGPKLAGPFLRARQTRRHAA